MSKSRFACLIEGSTEKEDDIKKKETNLFKTNKNTRFDLNVNNEKNNTFRNNFKDNFKDKSNFRRRDYIEYNSFNRRRKGEIEKKEEVKKKEFKITEENFPALQ
jgi:hypothetical protein